ncbi:hypothetical protein ACLB2K_051997 [Fragaria x ananassa]
MGTPKPHSIWGLHYSSPCLPKFKIQEQEQNQASERRIVVVVEDVEAARTALKWALQNLIRFGDFITLLHVFPSSRSKNKNKTRLLRLKGFRLALSFKDICDSFPKCM